MAQNTVTVSEILINGRNVRKSRAYQQAAQNLQKAEADYKEHGAPEAVLLRCPNCGIKIPGTVCPICGAEL